MPVSIAVYEIQTDVNWQAVIEDKRWHQADVKRLMLLGLLLPEERVGASMLQVAGLIDFYDFLERIDWMLFGPVRLSRVSCELELHSTLIVRLR